VGSGCAALIYEIVWFEMLQLSVGSSAVSLGVLLGTFMGGMCIGSLALSRLVSRRHHPLKVYAALELGVGAFGLLALVLLPIAGSVYLSIAGHGMPGFLLRGVVAAICLLPPTLAMSATLPAIARWVETTPTSSGRNAQSRLATPVTLGTDPPGIGNPSRKTKGLQFPLGPAVIATKGRPLLSNEYRIASRVRFPTTGMSIWRRCTG
jgi:hypothetical protein